MVASRAADAGRRAQRAARKAARRVLLMVDPVGARHHAPLVLDRSYVARALLSRNAVCSPCVRLLPQVGRSTCGAGAARACVSARALIASQHQACPHVRPSRDRHSWMHVTPPRERRPRVARNAPHNRSESSSHSTASRGVAASIHPQRARRSRRRYSRPVGPGRGLEGVW